jgi:hypothetical protein
MDTSSPRRSSSPRRLLLAILGTLVLLPVAVAGARFARRAAAPSPHGVLLALEVRTTEAGTPTDASPSSGVVLALNAMSDSERSRLADGLENLADQLERSHNPLVEDLDDGDAQHALARLMQERLPMLTAAAALAAGRWVSADGRTVVRATTECALDARCIPLGSKPGPGDDRMAARARFLAWPLAYAIVVRPPAEKMEGVVDALRSSVEGSHVALVLRHEDVQSLRLSAALPALADGVARIQRWAPDDMPAKDALRQLSAGSGSEDLRWLALPHDTLLVVPRLGAVATIDAFVREVQGRVAAVAPEHVEWLALPPA